MNFTAASLSMHANLLIGMHSKKIAEKIESHLAKVIIKEISSSFDSFIDSRLISCYFLPSQTIALEALLQELHKAKSTIRVAMFTLTHPQIIDALITAHKKGVDVRVAVDRSSARGASKKAISALQAQNIPCLVSSGSELFHHKWVYVDQKIFFGGSANWTKAAFEKNNDVLIKIFPLLPNERKQFESIWQRIEREAHGK